MAVIKVFNPTIEKWEIVGVGARGPEGPKGDPGADGKDADLTEVQAMIDATIGDVELFVDGIIGGT